MNGSVSGDNYLRIEYCFPIVPNVVYTDGWGAHVARDREMPAINNDVQLRITFITTLASLARFGVGVRKFGAWR